MPGGVAAFAQALAIDPPPDRGRFMFDVTRILYENPGGRKPSVAAFLLNLAQPAQRAAHDGDGVDRGATDVVPVPLTADVWGRAIFRRKIARDELVGAIVADHTAALLCHGLAALDDQTLQYFVEHVSMLTRIAERSAPVFAAFSSSLHIHASRVVPPGGDDAVALWEAVVGEKVNHPEAFVLRLFELSDGRVAHLFDTIGQLDAPRRAFALGLWIPDATLRLERFKVLGTAGINAYRDWHVRQLPFSHASYDLTMTLMRVTVDAGGVPRQPAARGFWSRVFAGSELPDDPARQMRAIDEDPFDAPWLVEAVASGDIRQRADRLDQIAFAQRVFGEGGDRQDVFVAVRAMARYRMLMLTLERIGIRSPAVFASAARQAARLGGLDGRRALVAEAQFQGALALIRRMTAVRSIDTPFAQNLVEGLVALPFSEQGRYAGAVAEWIPRALMKAAPPASTREAALLAILAGPASADGQTVRVVWEGQRYRLDLGAAERLRLERVREKQEALPIDVAFDVSAVARTLVAETSSVEDLQSILTRLTPIASSIRDRARTEEEDNGAQAALRKAVEDLTRAVKNKDLKRAARLAEPLLDASDELLSQALLSLAYAIELGDPDGTILLAEDVSRRHDFGFAVKDGEVRARTAWMVPRQDVSPGVPWHVAGSLLGLDVALAPLALRRVNSDRIIDAPRLTSNQREVFAVSVALMNPFDLRDVDRDVIADAIERGRRRVRELTGPKDVEAVASDLGFDGGRRRAVEWTLAHDPRSVESLITLTELLVLGGGRPADLNAWGMSMLSAMGCLCSRLTPPGTWLTLSGRPQLAVTAAGMADVHLQVAVRLKELGLPAPLARVVVSAAVQDFIDDVKPADEADWPTMTRRARAISLEQIEDYVAAATAAGPLVPDNAPF